METVCAYFPTPFVDLQPGQAEALLAENPTRLINSKRGVIQLVTPAEEAFLTRIPTNNIIFIFPEWPLLDQKDPFCGFEMPLPQFSNNVKMKSIERFRKH
ncbi:MAG: hypothetical protein ABSG01_00200 [Anaerolineales bacterium]|jgi:hypothetical protein